EIGCPALPGCGLERSVEVALHLFESDAGFQPAGHLKPPPRSILQPGRAAGAAVAAKLRIVGEGDGDVAPNGVEILDAVEPLRRHTHDGDRSGVHRHRLTDDAGLTAESLLPVSVADHRCCRCGWRVVFG